MEKIANLNNFKELIDNVYQTHSLLQQNAQKAINLNLTIRNWLIGCYIVEFEQNGEDRAKYGTRLLVEMAKSIKSKGIKGLDVRTLRSCRIFYNAYPQIRQTVFAELQKKLPVPIRGTLTPELQIANNQTDTIRGTLSPELYQPDYLLFEIRQSVSAELISARFFPIWRTLSAKLESL